MIPFFELMRYPLTHRQDLSFAPSFYFHFLNSSNLIAANQGNSRELVNHARSFLRSLGTLFYDLATAKLDVLRNVPLIRLGILPKKQ